MILVSILFTQGPQKTLRKKGKIFLFALLVLWAHTKLRLRIINGGWMKNDQNVIYMRQGKGHKPAQTAFDRFELMSILNVYGRMVSAGLWKDYAMDFEADFAQFSVYQRASEQPLYRIIKEPTLAQKQGIWRVLGSDGQVLKRGHDLDKILNIFHKKLIKAVD